MSNITDLNSLRPKKVEVVWQCECDGQLFYLHEDGTLECRSCKRVIESIEWIPRGQK